MKKSLLFSICLLLCSQINHAQTINLNTLKSFPTAEGYGQLSGVNQPIRNVYYVTNLNDSGAGSLRDALSQSNRLVLFKTAGTIVLSSEINTDKDNIYIAGQTAFYNGGEGITIKSDGNQNRGLLFFTGDHIVIRYLRLRRGPGNVSGENSGDNINFYGSSNWMLDHCSVSWSTDENISAGNSLNGTIQYTISSEGLYFSTHEYTVDVTHGSYQNGHSKGGVFGWENFAPNKLTFYRNLFAHNDGRNPRIYGPGSQFEIVNNLMYNNRYFNIELETNGQDIKTNVVKNLLIAGSDTRTNRYMVHTSASINDKVYMKGNIGSHRTNDTMSEWLEVGNLSNPIAETGRSLTPFTTSLSSNYDVLPKAQNLQSIILNDVGANLSSDAVDNRIFNDVINLTPTLMKTISGTNPAKWKGQTNYYGIINNPAEVGGWPTIAPMNSIVQDSNNDGIDDTWAAAHGVTNWDDVISTYTFNSITVNNYVGYTARQIYLAFLCDDFSRITNNDSTLNIEENQMLSSKQPLVYPNPATSEIKIIPNGISINKVELFDLQGKKIKQYSNNDFDIINIESLKPGVYILILWTLESKYHIKIIKQ